MRYLKSTGIVRKIDALGRIVVPKELRKILKIDVGDPVEIFTADNGYIVLKKYISMGSSVAINEFRNQIESEHHGKKDEILQHVEHIEAILEAEEQRKGER